MANLIVADSGGTEIREMVCKAFDFEVGDDENSFLITVERGDWEDIPEKGRLYVPGTEFGGLYRRLGTDSAMGTISPGGRTWRGMLQKKIISPAAGANYATDTGELNAIIKRRVEAEFPRLIFGTTESTNVTVTNFRYDRYCTLYDGLQKLLKSKGYRLRIRYDQTRRGVVVDAVLIRNYTDSIEFSEDYEANFKIATNLDGVNHLICLGSGELAARVVKHLYVDGQGNIGTTQTFFGADEVAEVYDYAGAAESDLIRSGSERLRDLIKNNNTFEIDLQGSADTIDIRDIVGGRDYLSGLYMTAPVTAKILRWKDGFATIEYMISNDVTVEE